MADVPQGFGGGRWVCAVCGCVMNYPELVGISTALPSLGASKAWCSLKCLAQDQPNTISITRT